MRFKEHLDDIIRKYREKRSKDGNEKLSIESYPIATDYPLYSQSNSNYAPIYNAFIDYYKKKRSFFYQPSYG